MSVNLHVTLAQLAIFAAKAKTKTKLPTTMATWKTREIKTKNSESHIAESFPCRYRRSNGGLPKSVTVCLNDFAVFSPLSPETFSSFLFASVLEYSSLFTFNSSNN